MKFGKKKCFSFHSAAEEKGFSKKETLHYLLQHCLLCALLLGNGERQEKRDGHQRNDFGDGRWKGGGRFYMNLSKKMERKPLERFM